MKVVSEVLSTITDPAAMVGPEVNQCEHIIFKYYFCNKSEVTIWETA